MFLRVLWLFLLSILASFTAIAETGFTSKAKVSARYDNRSNKDDRSQYRLRWYGEYGLTEKLSVNSFVATGNKFDSAYNTSDGSHDIHIRRIYLDYQGDNHITQAGVIPTYKGRVSSTGLSKDGWISGIRQVFKHTDGSQLEFVVGEMDHFDDPNAFQTVKRINYLEMEYTSAISAQWDYELSLERMLGENFTRLEIRHLRSENQLYSLELIDRLGKGDVKVVLSTTQKFSIDGYPLKLFSYYSYVNPDFGARAELTEDYLGSGHTFQFEIDGPVWQNLTWFSKLGFYESNRRFQLGLAMSF